MTDSKDIDLAQDAKKKLALAGKTGGRLELRAGSGAGGDAGQVRQSFPHGRSKTVQVEVRKKRAPGAAPAAGAAAAPAAEAPSSAQTAQVAKPAAKPQVLRALTEEERTARQRAIQSAIRADIEAKRRSEEEAKVFEEEMKRKAVEDAKRKQEDAVQKKTDTVEAQRIDEAQKKKAEEETLRLNEEEGKRRQAAEVARAAASPATPAAPATTAAVPAAMLARAGVAATAEDEERPRRPGAFRPGQAPGRGGVGMRPGPGKAAPEGGRDLKERRQNKMSVTQALESEETIRVRSLAAMKRAREKERSRMFQQGPSAKVVRDVVVPEAITVQELANRMAERGVDVIKSLMKMGVMATVNQTIDADTAELIVAEFGHKVKRVAEADVEIGLEGAGDQDEALEPRAPVVTIMGHVDHGKTSLLDALRETDVAKHEAGGITQHIGAYKVQLKNGQAIAFLDTPGHEAFTAMRARGAKVTDIVVLVVAADDGIQPQTIEAIAHAKAANVPVIVAINKVDKAGADSNRVRADLLQHGIAIEGFGGDVLGIDVSAKARTGLDKLEEAILLQAEILELRANPNRSAQGAIVEAKLERGRGPVATVLVQKGTLRVGDIFVAGEEWGRVRALVDERGKQIDAAGPSTPVEVIGLNGTPLAGDDFQVVETDARAREVTEFRQRRARDASSALRARGTLEQMFTKIQEGEAKELAVVVKTDVQGSLEAIVASLTKLRTDEVAVRVLHGAVGGITEGDIALAKASQGFVVGFNVRANPQAREMAKRDGIEIRYYSIIYQVIDEIKAALSGMLSPTLREKFLGNAEIRQIFNITKVGKVAGCRVVEGMVKRGAKVRLLRDQTVIHEGTLKTLRRFKDEVREVQDGYECGMAFENYEDIREGDLIECFEIEEVARTI
ncbi:MAG: translation initiation factor IF-2 [Magnetospirillum sp.]|jgi:translation initiation factor IF-2|nr:translation initiation factor IF-2 [Magnetospirillum sp.]